MSVNSSQVAITHKANPKYQKLRTIPTNEHDQATELYLCLCRATQIRTFDITSVTFWLCFFVWFCTTNIYVEISNDLNLTFMQHQLAGALSITSTIFFRLIVSYLCFKYGSRISYVIILIVTSLSLVGISLVQSVYGYFAFHLFLGIAGASFVVTQYHTTRMFSSEIVRFTQAISAGFGNFGGGVANFMMPLLMYYFHVSWRWMMIILAVIVFLFCFIYYLGTSDSPENPFSFIDPHKNKPPDKEAAASPIKDSVRDYRTWILFCCYTACFGVEITFYLVAAHYFQMEYNLNEITSGLIVMVWSSMSIFARPLGCYISSKYNMNKRVTLLFVILLLEAIFLISFGVIGHRSLCGGITSAMLFSICVQMAEGVTFNIALFIQPKSVGHVVGIVGSVCNIGAILFIFLIFIMKHCGFNQQYAWIILGCIVMIIAFITLKIKFTERELHDFSQTGKECFDLEIVKTNFITRNQTADELESKPSNFLFVEAYNEGPWTVI